MSEFKHLERAYLATVEASVRDLQASANAGPGSIGPGSIVEGFGESSQSYGFAQSGQDIDAAEAACLAYQAGKREELYEKIEFLLGQMRQLTDETEEFDVYAEQILADLKSFK